MSRWYSWLVVFLLSFSLHAQETINLTSGEWPPYLSKKLQDNGFAAAVVRESFNAVDMQVRYGYFPWKRSYLYAKHGADLEGDTWDGSVVWLYTEERANNFYYSDPIVIDDGILYHLKSNPISWTKVEDLQGLVIGGTKHTVYDIFQKAESNNILTIERAGYYDILFDRLLAKRIDAVPQVKKVADYFLYKNYSQHARDKITHSETIFERRVYHLILNKHRPENKHYIELFNQGLKRIKANGVYDDLVKKLNSEYFYNEAKG